MQNSQERFLDLKQYVAEKSGFKFSFFEFLKRKRNQRIIALALVLNIVLQSSPLIDPTGFLARTDIFSRNQGENLVLVLTDETLLSDRTAFTGLSDQYDGLRNSTLENRIERYAQDIQSKLNNTKVEILTVKPTQKPEEVAALLKQAYLQNLDQFNNRKLVGTVLVGDVPLPVVDKNGNRFPSIYPYSDFEDPIYVFNPETQFFEESTLNKSTDFEPEIWHGVINFDTLIAAELDPSAGSDEVPVTEQKQYLAQFLDKNHLYHQGEEGFAEFEKKIFYSEPVHEKNSLNANALNNYEKYQIYNEELVYNRFSSRLFNLVTGFNSQDIEELYKNPTNRSESILPSLGDLPETDLSMFQPIESSLETALDVYSSSLSKQVEALGQTGRYDTKNIFTPITAIAQKDEYQAEYFKLVNQLVESKIDQAATAVQQNITIPNGAILSGTVQLNSGSSVAIEPITFVNNAPTFRWINQIMDDLPATRLEGDFTSIQRGTVERGDRTLSDGIKSLFDTFTVDAVSNTDYIKGFGMAVNGNTVASLTSAAQCRIFRGGGTDNPLDKTVRVGRGPLPNLQTPAEPICYMPTNQDSETVNLESETVASTPSVTNPNFCSEFFGFRQNEPYRAVGVDSVPNGALTHESCFTMRPVNEFNRILNLKYQGPDNSQEKLDSINRDTDSSQIAVSIPGFSGVTLADLLENLPGFTNRQANDWNAWSFYLLANPIKNSFEIQNPEGLPGVSKITLNIQKINGSDATNSISSIIKHQDPTPQMLEAIQFGQTTQELPINATRYLSFVDKQGNNQSIAYPNVFKSTSLADFRTKLQAIETKLSALSGENYAGQLTSILSRDPETFSTDYTKIQNLNQNRLSYLLNWRSLTLSQKYYQIYSNILDQTSPNKFIGFPNSFEIAVITAQTEDNGIDLSVLPEDFTNISLVDALNQNFSPEANIFKEQIEQEQLDRNLNEAIADRVPVVQNSCNNSPNGIPLVEWFTNYLPCWLDSVSNLGEIGFAATSKTKRTYAQEISNPDAEVAKVSLELVAGVYSQNQFENAQVRVSILDASDQKIVGKPVAIILSLSGPVAFAEKFDADLKTPGQQLFMASGEAVVDLSISTPGTAKISAKLNDLTAEKTFTIHTDLSLKAEPIGQSTTPVANPDGVQFRVKMLNQANQPQQFNQPILKLNNPALGKIELITTDLQAQEFIYKFTPNTTSAQAVIQVSYPNLQPIDYLVSILPGPPEKLYFRDLLQKVDTQNPQNAEAETIEFTAVLEAVDQYNNRVVSDLSDIQLSLSDSEKVELEANSVNLLGGKAEISLQALPNSFGSVYLTASKDGLTSGINQIQLSEKLSKAQFSAFSSPALYYELRLNQDSSGLAHSILKNGKAQAISTLSTKVDDYAPVFYVHPKGAFQIADGQAGFTTTLTAQENRYQYSISDPQNQEVAWVQVSPVGLEIQDPISAESEISENGIYTISELQSEEGSEETTNLAEYFSLDPNGFIIPKSANVTLRVLPNSKYFAIQVLASEQPIATVYYAIDSGNALVKRNLGNINYSSKTGYTQPSTNAGKGAIFYNLNQKLSQNQQPSTAVNRTNSALQVENQGLGTGAASLLLFTAGASAGEATRSYLSEAGILVGDPVASLEPSTAGPGGFNQDIGKLLGKTDSDINHILKLDNQLLFADQDGNISRFDSENQRFYKNLVRIPNGIKEIISSKATSSRTQLIVLAETACTNQDNCLYQIVFEDDAVKTIPLEVALPVKAVKILSFDNNNDGDEDLLVLGENNLLYLFQRVNQAFNRQPTVIGNVYNQLPTDSTIQDSLYIFAESGFTPSSTQSFLELNLPVEPRLDQVTTDPQNSLVTQPFEALITNQKIKLYPVQSIPGLSATFRTTDLNGELLRANDKIRYTVTLNPTSGGLQNFKLSLAIPTDQTVDQSTLRPSTLVFEPTQNQFRNFVISGPSLAQNSTTQITFETTYAPVADSSTQLPLISLVSNEGDTSPDEFKDIKVVLTNQNKVLYYHSNLNSENQNFSYQRKELELPKKQVNTTQDSPVPTQIPTSDQGKKDLAKELRKQQLSGSNPNIEQSLQRATTKVNELGSNIESGLNKLRCQGKGCLAMPVNRAFLVPSPPAAALPIFGWGCPAPPFIWPGASGFQGCAGGRQYLSPTLTGEFVSATCVGPFMGGACWVFRLGDIGAACDAINTFATDLLNEATDLISEGTSALSGGLLVVGPTAGNQENITIPGFPSILTDWYGNQIREITSKLLDLPDLTLIYPSAESLLGYFSPVEANQAEFEDIGYLGLENALAEISAIPLFDINIETQTVKYPYIPNVDEFTKYYTQALQIRDQIVFEAYQTFENWSCYARGYTNFTDFNAALSNSNFRTFITNAVFDNPNIDSVSSQGCIQLAVAFEGFYLGFTANLEALKDYRDLPKNIFALENFVADYAEQVIGYADVILDRSAGFLVDNTQSLVEWQNFLYKIQNLISEFSILIDFLVNFISSCDNCRTNRTNADLQFLLSTFLQFPTEIPIFVFPKLPDITLDVSKIEAGIDITLPAFEFVPERISLPDLNNFLIDLPDNPPVGLNINFAEFGLSPVVALPPAPDLEKIIVDFPPLPELQVPELPVIPRPPDIGLVIEDFLLEIKAPLDFISALLRIICILFQSAIPVPEFFLRTHIESLTNRPLEPILPIDKGLSFQFPGFEYDYITEYKIILETYLDLDFEQISQLTQRLVNELNTASDRIVEGVDFALSRGADALQPPVTIDLNALTENIDLEFDVNANPQDAVDELNPDLNFEPGATSYLDTRLKKLYKEYDQIPTEFNLVATTSTLTPEQVKNYKPKNLANLPPVLKQKRSELIAYKNQINSKSSARIASINAQKFQEDQNLIAQTFRISQATPFQTPTLDTPVYQPEKGIYYVSPDQRVNKLVAYSAETSKPTKVSMLDFDSDSDTDAIYTRGNQIFFKESFNTNPRTRPVTGAIRTFNFEDIDQIDLATVTETTVTANTENRTATFELPQSFQNSVVVIDIYNAQFDSAVKENRYIINGLNSENSDLTDQSNFSYQGLNLGKDSFKNMFVKSGFSNSISIDLQNQNYRASISLLNPETEELNIIQQSIPITPNICKDSVAPDFSTDIAREITVSLYEPVDLDFSQVSDFGSNLKSIYLDLNLTQDSNSDDDPTNDWDLPRNRTELVQLFRLTPFTTVGTYPLTATAVDEAGNSSNIQITINVVPPQVTLNNPLTQIDGATNPPISDIPATIIRERDGVIEELGQVSTSQEGEFNLDELNDSESMLIRDQSNAPVFEINPKTGSLKALTDSASVAVNYAQNPGSQTILELKKSGQTITTLTKVSDINQDSKIVTQKPTKTQLQRSSNVYALDENPQDQIQLSLIPGDNPDYAGGVSIKNGSQEIAIIDTNGAIKRLSAQLGMRLETISDLRNYQWFEIIFNGQKVASFIPTFANKEAVFTNPQTTQRQARPIVRTTPNSAPTQSPSTPLQDFADVADTSQNADIIKYLQEKGVVEGVLRNGQRFFEPTRQITRAEYSKIILEILCLEPSAQSFQRPSVFNDIPFGNPLPWYYSYTKETNIQKLFTGYLGEVDPITNLPPFKPNNSITLAEATKVILEALVLTDAIDISSIETGNPWYAPYLQVARSIEPYLNPSVLTTQDFIITQQEASTPNRFITREEFAVIAFRVLSVRNCLETNATASPQAPSSQTQVPTSPTPAPQQPTTPASTTPEPETSAPTPTPQPNQKATNAGLYMQKLACITCPCQYRYEYLETLRKGDKIYAVLRDPETGKIIQKSQEINISQ